MATLPGRIIYHCPINICCFFPQGSLYGERGQRANQPSYQQLQIRAHSWWDPAIRGLYENLLLVFSVQTVLKQAHFSLPGGLLALCPSQLQMQLSEGLFQVPSEPLKWFLVWHRPCILGQNVSNSLHIEWKSFWEHWHAEFTFISKVNFFYITDIHTANRW